MAEMLCWRQLDCMCVAKEETVYAVKLDTISAVS